MLFRHISPHAKAVLQALFVTFLWSTSWVFIKFGLTNIPVLTFAGLRYSLAFLCLLPLVLQPVHLKEGCNRRRSAFSRFLNRYRSRP